MQTQFEAFDAEGVFDQPIKPLRLRKRNRLRIKKELFIPISEGSALNSRAIRQTMHGPKLLRHAMPIVLPPDPATQIMPAAYWHQVFMQEQAEHPTPCNRNVLLIWNFEVFDEMCTEIEWWVEWMLKFESVKSPALPEIRKVETKDTGPKISKDRTRRKSAGGFLGTAPQGTLPANDSKSKFFI